MLRHPIYGDYSIDRIAMEGVNSHRLRILFGGVAEGLPGPAKVPSPTGRGDIPPQPKSLLPLGEG